MKESTNTSAN